MLHILVNHCIFTVLCLTLKCRYHLTNCIKTFISPTVSKHVINKVQKYMFSSLSRNLCVVKNKTWLWQVSRLVEQEIGVSLRTHFWVSALCWKPAYIRVDGQTGLAALHAAEHTDRQTDRHKFTNVSLLQDLCSTPQAKNSCYKGIYKGVALLGAVRFPLKLKPNYFAHWTTKAPPVIMCRHYKTPLSGVTLSSV